MLFNVTSWDSFPLTFTFWAFQAEGSCYLFSKQTLDIKEKVFQLCHESAIFAPHPIKASYIISVSENKMYSVYKWWNRERNHDSSIKWVLSGSRCVFLHNHFFFYITIFSETYGQFYFLYSSLRNYLALLSLVKMKSPIFNMLQLNNIFPYPNDRSLVKTSLELKRPSTKPHLLAYFILNSTTFFRKQDDEFWNFPVLHSKSLPILPQGGKNIRDFFSLLNVLLLDAVTFSQTHISCESPQIHTTVFLCFL